MEEDRISALPDGVISHILNFLPTETAVTTSVLSKSWYPRWRSIPNIDLSDEFVPQQDLHAYQRYKEFVLSVLHPRDVTQPIKRFVLKQQNHHDNPILNKCISVVLHRGVSTLSSSTHVLLITISCHLAFSAACPLWSSFFVNHVSSVQLPLLKFLHLVKVQFAECKFLKEILSGCPNLELFVAVTLKYVEEDESKGGFTSLTKLKKGVIRDCDFKFPLEAFYNVGYLNLDIREVSRHYDIVPSFYNLTKMKLSFYEEYRWQWLVELLDHCPKLQILDIHNKMEILHGIRGQKIPFNHGSKVTLRLVRQASVEGACWEEIGSKPDESWVCPSLVPECVSLHLRECTILDYEGMEGELQFARYILKNANVLQTMTIQSSSSSNSDKKLQILQELSLCPRSSATCILSFK